MNRGLDKFEVSFAISRWTHDLDVRGARAATSWCEWREAKKQQFPDDFRIDDTLSIEGYEQDHHYPGDVKLARFFNRCSTYNAGFRNKLETFFRLYFAGDCRKPEREPTADEMVDLLYALAESLYYTLAEVPRNLSERHLRQRAVDAERESAHLRLVNEALAHELGKHHDGPRRAVTVKMRNEVLERDGYQCLNCGESEDLHIDHIVPFSDGGACAVENLQTLCRSCNLRKHASFLDLRKVGAA